MGGVDTEGGELRGVVLVICTEDGCCACDLQALCTAGFLVLIIDGERCVFVLLECAEFLPAFGEDDEFAITIFIREWGATDKVAVGDGKGAGVSRLDECVDSGAQFGFGHFDGGFVLPCPEYSGFFVVYVILLVSIRFS